MTAHDVVRDLTLEEKAALCVGSDFWHTAAVERLGIASVMVSDGPHGLRRQAEGGDHIGLGTSVPATCFPTAAALGSSWDTALVQSVGEAVGREARAQGVSVVLGPGMNIKRSPLCGRNFEYLSEDPVVSGVLASALVDGIQSTGVGTSVKHFAVNNQETDRLRVSADVDERTLREIYLLGFEHVVTRSRPWTVMCAYNKVNGTYASEHRWLLTTVLREEWGFDGLVMSDWGAVHDRVAALAAGLDLEMPPNHGVSDVAIVEAVKDGSLPEPVLDLAVRRVLQLVERSGTTATDGHTFDADAHHALARSVAAQCSVLLRNDGGLLPLAPVAGSRIALVGEFARTPRYQGAGSSQVNPTRVDTALDELRALLPDGVELTFAPGFGIEDASRDGELADEAVAAAAGADVVVAVLGLPASAESEGFDRTHLDLPAAQTALVERLLATNPRLVVVLANGSAVTVAGWADGVPALLECWLGGQAGGGAIADVLLGVTAPSGRLAETLPIRLSDNAAQLNFPGEEGHVRYGEGVFVGYRGYDAAERPVSFPFGHGLTYTTFAYGDVSARVGGSVSRSVEESDLRVEVDVEVTNTGARRGKEVVQLYVRDVEASVARPVRELKAFEKVDLAPGQSTRVTFVLDARDLSFWSTRAGRWVVESGQFELLVGASSRDLRGSAVVEVEAPPVRLALDEMSTLEEWLADPEGGPALRAAIGTDESGNPAGILGAEDLILVIGNFPISTLAAFGMGIDHATVDRLVAGRR